MVFPSALFCNVIRPSNQCSDTKILDLGRKILRKNIPNLFSGMRHIFEILKQITHFANDIMI